MKSFRLTNRILGWLTFGIAAFTYLSTVEPTVSFWDVGEFIASAYKLEVGHPPGAPLFMLLARIFSLFTFGDATKVAMLVNSMSGLASALTVMFLFWTIVHLARKFYPTSEVTKAQTIVIFGSGLVGALAFTFTDTFWFSAVEGEVYALSSLFTAVVFWAILKWENIADEKYANRWLILIAYLMGLSIGVHLLNLLAIPSIVFVYYFKKYRPTTQGFLSALLISLVLLGVIMYIVINGLVKIAGWFELLFVNSFELPFNSGVVLFALLIVGLLVWFIYSTYQKKQIIWNTILTGLAVILIGYSSFALIVIRSIANPPMDENNPETVFALSSYLNREQYGSRPLLYGQYYNAPIVGQEENYMYIQQKKNGDHEYVKGRQSNPTYKYDPKFKTLFPRMYSRDKQDIQAYKKWGSINGRKITTRNRRGEQVVKEKPSFLDNLEFFFTYQVGFMYGRYFMWNFAGRQNDTQGHGGYLKGNWLSGIDFIDKMFLGKQTGLPDYLKNNKARNTYYFLPLILGILGLIYTYRKNIHIFWIILLLFLLTGIAIVMYLNQTPYQPRERDYAYAGSFYAFAIWIGLGVAGLHNMLRKITKPMLSAVLSTVIGLMLVPGILAAENWDDHDRSDRYTARDFARNYLDSCEKNAILFTYGDNDTFPLWYVQEVEGYRTDIRVVNLSLLSTDWYITQTKRKAYESDPVPFSLKKSQYIQGKRDLVPVVQKVSENKHVNAEKVMNFIASNEKRTKLRPRGRSPINYMPTKYVSINVDSARVVENRTVPEKYAHRIEDTIKWKIGQNYLSKNQLMIFDLLAQFDWKRPVYFATSISQQYFLGLKKYLRDEGFAYRFVPYKKKSFDGNTGHVIADLLYKRLMKQFDWGNINSEDVFIDYQNRRTMRIMGIRKKFNRLAGKLNREGEHARAIKVLDRCRELMPRHKVPYNHTMANTVKHYYDAGATEKANNLAREIVEVFSNRLDYYLGLRSHISSTLRYEKSMAFRTIRQMANFARNNNQQKLFEEFDKLVKEYYPMMSQK